MSTSVSIAGRRTGDRATRWQTCFISAPVGVNLGTLKALLRERGIEPLVLSELPPVGTSILDQVANVSARADFVVAVLRAGDTNANVYYEIGYAQALGKRVLVLAPPGLALDSDIVSMPFVQADADNRRVIDFALDQVLAAPQPGKSRLNGTVDTGRPIGSLSHELIGELDSLGHQTIKKEDIASIVERALRASGISVVVRSLVHDNSADMAIWSDDVDTWGGNPLLLEIKRDLQDQRSVEQTRAQVAGYLESSNSRAALVLYVEGPPSRELVLSPLPLIMFLQVRELLERLATTGFGGIMRELRNRAAHGIDV